MNMTRAEYMRKYQKAWLQKRRKQWILENGPCVKCGSDKKLEVDHIDPATKTTKAVWSWKHDRRMEELAKCQVLCHCCHKEKTKIDLRKMFLGKPHLKQRTVSDEKMRQALALVKQGLSERKACEMVGICRGTFSSAKIRKHRRDIFCSEVADN